MCRLVPSFTMYWDVRSRVPKRCWSGEITECASAIDVLHRRHAVNALQASLAAEMFNSGRMGWEPVIEPWSFRAGLTVAHPTESPARSLDASTGPSCMSASFASDAMLEGTMTLAQFDTAAAAMRVVRQVWRSQREQARHSTIGACSLSLQSCGFRNPHHGSEQAQDCWSVGSHAGISDCAKGRSTYVTSESTYVCSQQ